MIVTPLRPVPAPEREEAVSKFLSFCHTKRYPHRKEIIKPGDSGDTLYYIIEGSVAITMQEETEDGKREIVLAYMNRGEYIGEAGIFIGEMTRSVSVVTRTPCQLAEIKHSRFLQLLKTELKPYSTELLFSLGEQLSVRLLQTSRKVSHLAYLDVTGRIARTLMDLCKEPDAMTHPDGMQIRITRQELGRIVGCSREMAGRVLKVLEEQKLLSAKGKTIVVYGTR
ncbi:MAG: cAMP-activated global transcriptional regulator CRP [Gammaproteobacteria bacterium]|nr:cAMP-activated global transcriptional regulator CRP [Gammaproteobacteria bacterium]